MENNKWNLSAMPELSGKVCIVTGGNSGLGYETVYALASKGAEVVMTSRSKERGEASRQKLLSKNPKGKIHVYTLDLTSLKSIESFSNSFKKSFKRLDILVNNAGIMMVPYNKTEDGFESQLGTNHLAHFALTGQLVGLIQKTPQARIVNVSSLAHKQGKMDFKNLMYEEGKGYNPISAYGRSKLSNLLFTSELQEFFKSSKIEAVAVSAHPGVSDTNLANHLEKKLLFKIVKPIFSWFGQSADIGALPQIRAAVDPSVKGNEFFGPGGKRQMKGHPVIVNPKNPHYNSENAKKLWELSSELTGVKYS